MTELKIVVSIKDDILHDLTRACDAYSLFLEALNACDADIKAFYGQGESLEEALNNKIFDINGFVATDARDYLSEHLPYATSLWDGNTNEAMSIMFSATEGKTNINIDLERHKGIYNINNIKRIFTAPANKFTLNYFSVFYSNSTPVFSERPCAGWMIYLPITCDVSMINAAEKIEDIDLKSNKGKLFIVKSDYDFLDDSHKIASNDLEIELVDAGLLPLYKNI
ncbi:immunity 52 family protein [Shigella flexneri]|nr:immunity 52 family protein [Escherichia coli]